MAPTDSNKDVVIDSKGDVFADLGLNLSDEDLLKVKIARVISNVVQSGGYTQAQLAGIIGSDQPKVSRLLRGRLKEFSVERMMQYLMLLGYDIEVRFPKTAADERGKVRVVGY